MLNICAFEFERFAGLAVVRHYGYVLRVCAEEELSNMRKELDKYGIQMPQFNKIGGILANELSVDEAARKYLD